MSQQNITAVQSYAQALFNVGKAQGVIEDLLRQSAEIDAVLTRKPEYGFFLETPQIGTDEKRNLTKQTFEGKVHELMMNLLLILIDRERALLLKPILQKFQELVEREQGIHPASVASARELTEDEKTRLQNRLEKFTGSRLKIQYRVRPELIGGVIFRYQDTLVDGSVQRFLRELKEKFQSAPVAASAA